LLGLYGLMLGSAILVFLAIRRSHRSQEELLNYSLTGARVSDGDHNDLATEVRSYLKERALIISSLLVRAASEIHLHESGRPDGQVVTRQVQNTFLRQRGLWDKLEPDEAVLMATPDGGWEQEHRNQVTEWCEQLRLLRWALRIDLELTPLAHFPKADLALARELTSSAKLQPSSGPLLGAWDLRQERDIASGYLAHVFGELKGRGLIGNGAESEVWAAQIRDQFSGPSKDLLAGSKTIGELDETNLRLIGLMAAARQQYAAYLAEQMASDTPISFTVWLSRVH